MESRRGSDIIKDWPEESQEAAQLVVDTYGEPTTEFFTPLAEFDGSVIVERTAGELSARCHDEQANFLALNCMHDMVTGKKDVAGAQAYYAKEFADARRKAPTPYMEKLHFTPGTDTTDPGQRALSDEELEEAQNEGEQTDSSTS